MKLRTFPVALVTVLAVGALSLDAATITTSSMAPTVDGEDIANLDLTNSFSNFGSSFMWPDRPARGQTFTTGADPSGYTLDAITVQTDRSAVGTRNFSLRVGSISGSSFTPLGPDETATSSMDLSTNDYVTFLLDTSLTLDPNTVYGFDMGVTGANPNSFSTVGMALLNNAQTDYAGGTAFSSGSGGLGGATINGHNQDRIFHLNLASNAAAVPEPTSIAIWSLIGMGLAGFGYYRTRRKK